MTDRTGVLAAVALAAVLVGSAVLMPIVPGGVPSAGEEATATPTPKSGEVYTPDPQTAANVDRDREELGDLNVVPDSRVEQMSNDRRASGAPAPDSVRASAGTQTMEIETTVVDGEPALVLEDDRTHDGRWVSVSTDWLEEAHGEVPSTVTIEHESGDVYSESVRVRGDSAAFYVREFSTNTVTFSGEISITADPADDGSQYSYDIADLDAASDVTVNMTGVTNTETETRSWSGVASGGSKTVDVAGNQAPTEQSVTFVGEESLSAQSRSGTGVSTGSTTVDVGGDADPRNVEITFTGRTSTSNGDQSWTGLSDGESKALSMGNLEPTGPASDEPRISVTAANTQESTTQWDGTNDISYYQIGDASGVNLRSENLITQTPDEPVDGLKLHFDNEASGTITMDIYIDAGGSIDNDATDGTLVKSDYTFDASNVGGTTQTIELDQAIDLSSSSQATIQFVTTSADTDVKVSLDGDDSVSDTRLWINEYGEQQIQSGIGLVTGTTVDATVSTDSGQSTTFSGLREGDSASSALDISADASTLEVSIAGANDGVDVSVEKTDRTASEDPSVDVDGDGGAEGSYNGILTDGETATKSVSGLSLGSNTLDWSRTAGSYDWSLAYDRVDHTTDPSVDVDGDGTDEASVSGTLAPGETATQSVSGLSLGSNTLDVSTSSVTTGLEVGWTETTQTVDPGVELNGETTSVSGEIADGETVQRTINQSAVQEGTNLVNVSVGDGTLDADAPPAQVRVEFAHDAVDRQAVDYSAEQWTSRYEVSKSYASARSNATLTIPFDSSDVVSMRAVEIRFNSSTWTAMSESNYALDGTELTADLSAAYGGEIPAGTTVDVRANASKIDPINGSITVIEATGVDEELDTEVRVDSVSGTLRIATPDETIHYAHNASYQTGDYWVADQQGQRLQLPDAQSSDTLRVSTIPVVADPETGDVHVTVENTSATEPAFRADEGQAGNDAVQYTFVNASDGQEYALYSLTHDIVRDSGTASSPLTLEDDDSTETLKFLLSTDGATTGGGGDDPANSGIAPIGQNGGTDWVPLIVVALALGGLVVASRNSETVTNAGSEAGESVEGALDGVPVVGPPLGNIVSGGIQGVAQLARALVENRTIAVALAGAIGWGAIQAGIIELPAGSTVIVLVAAVSVLAAVGLRESGQWNITVWAGITVTTAAMAAVLLSDADPIAAVTNSDIFPLVAIGALYLAYRALKVVSNQFGGSGDGTNEVTLNVNRGDE